MNHHSLFDKLKNLHLLYVEDDPQIRSQICEFLGRYFASVQEASSAEEAMVCFEQKRPDIMLIDINLPGKNGLFLAEKVRENHHDIRIIVSTAYTDKEFLLQAVELELTRYLVKPVIGKKLLEALEKASNEYARILGEEQLFELGEGFQYDLKKRLLTHNSREIVLRRREMQLLEYFIEHSGEVVSYHNLEYDVWEDSVMSRDAIRAQIRNVRKKIHANVIENISAIGYRLSTKEAI